MVGGVLLVGLQVEERLRLLNFGELGLMGELVRDVVGSQVLLFYKFTRVGRFVRL